jgi:hypothetical protein
MDKAMITRFPIFIGLGTLSSGVLLGLLIMWMFLGPLKSPRKTAIPIPLSVTDVACQREAGGDRHTRLEAELKSSSG